MYLMYEHMVAIESSTGIAEHDEGFVPIDPSHLSSIAWKCKHSRGSFRDLVEAKSSTASERQYPGMRPYSGNKTVYDSGLILRHTCNRMVCGEPGHLRCGGAGTQS